MQKTERNCRRNFAWQFKAAAKRNKNAMFSREWITGKLNFYALVSNEKLSCNFFGTESFNGLSKIKFLLALIRLIS